MFSELSVFLATGGIFATLQFYKLNCLVGNNQFCLVLKTEAAPVFWVFKGGVCLFQLHLRDECCAVSHEVILCLDHLYSCILNCVTFLCVSNESLCLNGVLRPALVPFV